MKTAERYILIIILLGCGLLLSGCNNVTGREDFDRQMDTMQELLLAENWEKLNVHMDRLNEIYNKHEWKLQLLGDEGEYERVHELINRLRAAIELKNIELVSVELVTLKTIFEEIYSL